MKIKDHLLYDDSGKQVQFKQSPNIGKGVNKTQYVVLHYTGAKTASSAIGWMLDPSAKVSAHLHLDRDGNILQLVKFNQVAWHAGESYLDGITGLNSYSIGVEMQNDSTQQYTDVQLAVLVKICKAIQEAYPIKKIVGHSTIAPKRKIDPEGSKNLFNWTWFNQQMKDSKVETKVTISDLNLRAGAGTTFKIVSTLPKGTEVSVISTTGNWSQVFICSNQLTGFVNNTYLK